MFLVVVSVASGRDAEAPGSLGFSTEDLLERTVVEALGPTSREEADGVGDLLAGWTTTDEPDSRFKTWRSVVLEGTQETFSDSVASVPATVLTACRKMLQKGGEPRRFFADRAKELAWGRMITLIDVFYHARCCDLRYIEAQACMGPVSRRLHHYTEACAHGVDAPICASAKHFSCVSPSLYLVPPGMQSCASRLRKEKAEPEGLRARAKTYVVGARREDRGCSPGGRFAGGVVGQSDEKKGNGKRDGRGLEPRPST